MNFVISEDHLGPPLLDQPADEFERRKVRWTPIYEVTRDPQREILTEGIRGSAAERFEFLATSLNISDKNSLQEISPARRSDC